MNAKFQKHCMLLAVFAGFAISDCALAQTVVRSYDRDSIAIGETKIRDIDVDEPSPYVGTSPLAIAFAPKFELPFESWDVVFLRLNILVGSHRSVYALDLGGLGNFVEYKMDGIEIAGLFNAIGESDGSVQVAGIFNFAAFDASGCQIAGIYSGTDGTFQGLQIAFANHAGRLCGAQIGCINYAERLTGVQIGVANLNGSSFSPFMPIVNFAF